MKTFSLSIHFVHLAEIINVISTTQLQVSYTACLPTR